jgi:hypothetical protein
MVYAGTLKGLLVAYGLLNHAATLSAPSSPAATAVLSTATSAPLLGVAPTRPQLQEAINASEGIHVDHTQASDFRAFTGTKKVPSASLAEANDAVHLRVFHSIAVSGISEDANPFGAPLGGSPAWFA